MHIVKIKATPLRMPLQKAFTGATYRITERCTIITEVSTDQGISGKTFLGDNRNRQMEVVELINQMLGPCLQGEDPLCLERCWQKMFQLTLPLGDRAVLCEAIAAVDVALWDLMGKACKQPVFKLLGGYTDRLPPIVIAGYYQRGIDTDVLCEEMQEIQSQGYAGAKVKVAGLSPLDDAKRIEAIRKAVGEDFILACDANQGWSRDEAVQFGRAVKDLRVRWLEEPVNWHDEIGGMRYVREKTAFPVCAGQSEFSHESCLRLITGRAVDILNYDVSIGAGISDWLKVAKMAELHQIHMAHHEEPLISMHLMAAIPYGLYPEYFQAVRDPLTPGLVTNLPEIKEGWVTLPQAPGFNVKLDTDFIEKYRLE